MRKGDIKEVSRFATQRYIHISLDAGRKAEIGDAVMDMILLCYVLL